MFQRVLSIAAAAALASAGLVATAPASHADDCVAVLDGTFAGTTVCVVPDLSPLVPTVYWTVIPVVVNPICVGTTCTPTLTQHVSVPTGFSDSLDVYGKICVTVDKQTKCTPFQDDILIGSLSGGITL